jgi:hypothetical protein
MTSLKIRIIRQTNYTSILQASTDGRVWIDVMAGGHWAAVDKAQQLRELRVVVGAGGIGRCACT